MLSHILLDIVIAIQDYYRTTLVSGFDNYVRVGFKFLIACLLFEDIFCLLGAVILQVSKSELFWAIQFSNGIHSRGTHLEGF